MVGPAGRAGTCEAGASCAVHPRTGIISVSNPHPFLAGCHFEQHAHEDKDFLKQVWFAGNHSDIGGSYPEEESRLSDIALKWMIDEIEDLGLPLIVNRNRLHLFPSSAGTQHCEVLSTKEKLKVWTWPTKPRTIHPDAVLHESVLERMALPQVRHLREYKAYRPEALHGHSKTSAFYSAVEQDTKPKT